MLLVSSEFSIIFHTLDSIVILGKGFVDVVGVGGVHGSLFQIGVGITFSKNFFTGGLVFFDHLDGENVIDFDVMSGNTVVQEVGREHHVVARVPELWVILSVEVENISSADESETSHDA